MAVGTDSTTERKPRHRRRFPRVPSDYPVLVRRLGDAELENVSRTRSIGLGGCSFISAESYGENTVLELMISVNLRVVTALSRVVYGNAVTDGFEIGVEFLSLGMDERRILERLFNLDWADAGGQSAT